ncbi:MAG: hypothetical protein JW839_10080 [Candidatus Lokiarchaeota archaeon]|nr:hypothetical protein [Candidatus Lokiarchaeota archaeon]
MATKTGVSRFLLSASLILVAALFLVILGTSPIPRQPVHDVAYVVGAVMIYAGMLVLVVLARRAEAPYRKPVFKPSLAKDLRRRNELQVLLFTVSLGTSLVAGICMYLVLRAITRSFETPLLPVVHPDNLIFVTIGCFLASVFSFTAGAAVHATIAGARKAYHGQFMAEHQASQPPSHLACLLSVHDKESRILNIIAFLIALALAITNILVLLFDGSDLLYHNATGGLASIGMFLLSLWGMLFGLMHLAHSLPPKEAKATPSPSMQVPGTATSRVPLPLVRGNANRVIVLVIVFSLVGAIGTQYSAYVFSQATPADEDLYILKEHAVVANSTSLPTNASVTCALPGHGIDDVKVVLRGRAIAPCYLTATITCTFRFYNGTIQLGESYTRTASDGASCTGSTQSEASFSSTYNGFPVMQLDNITIGITLLSCLNNSDARVVITVYKMNDANRLFLERESVGFMCGATMITGWFYVLVAVTTFLSRDRRRRAWQDEVLYRNPGAAGGDGTRVP